MSYPHPHRTYPEDHLQPGLIDWWARWRPAIFASLAKGKSSRRSFNGDKTDNLFIYPSEQFIMENVMNGRKPKNNVRGDSNKSSQPAPLVWVNCPLEDKDFSELEQSTSSLESLAAMLVGLVGDGYGISVKYNFERESFNCTIYRPPCDGNRRNLGLSGSAPDLRDSILVTLYRFDTKLNGSLDDNTPVANDTQPGRRFR